MKKTIIAVNVYFIDGTAERFNATNWSVKPESGIVSIEKIYKQGKDELVDTVAHVAFSQVKYIAPVLSEV